MAEKRELYHAHLKINKEHKHFPGGDNLDEARNKVINLLKTKLENNKKGEWWITKLMAFDKNPMPFYIMCEHGTVIGVTSLESIEIPESEWLQPR